MKYWLWIIPSWQRGLWKFCCRSDVAAMEYRVGVHRKAAYNRSLAEQIKVGDRVVAYLNENLVGGVGIVTKPFYEDSTGYRSEKGESWAQRIGVQWQTSKEPVDVRDLPDVKAYRDSIKPMLHTQTIHEINADVYEQIAAAIRGR